MGVWTLGAVRLSHRSLMLGHKGPKVGNEQREGKPKVDKKSIRNFYLFI